MWHNEEVMISFKDSVMTKEEFEDKEVAEKVGKWSAEEIAAFDCAAKAASIPFSVEGRERTQAEIEWRALCPDSN